MSNIIIYGSKYGTTKKYAEKLSRRTNIQAISFENVNDISNKEIILVTVGLADPTDE